MELPGTRKHCQSILDVILLIKENKSGFLESFHLKKR